MIVLKQTAAYVLALLVGIVVLSVASPVLVIYGVSLSDTTGWGVAFLFGLAASIVPYLIAVSALRSGSGQDMQIFAGACVAVASVAVLAIVLQGVSGLHLLYSFRAIVGILIAGGIAGFTHHRVLGAAKNREAAKP